MDCEHGWRNATDCDACTRARVVPTAEARIAELEAMATEMVYAIPGGSTCDPQQVSDALREIAAKHGVQIKD